jgi:L-threonylcarbamoyladenylate synthase
MEQKMVLNKNNPETIQIVSSLIKSGGVGVLPCDTIYGLCSLVGIGEKPLRFVKNRPDYKPFLLVCTMDQVRSICRDGIPKDIESIWPAPLTVILYSKSGIPTAMRVPDDPFLQKLLETIGSPLYSTSVNTSGEPTLLNFSEIRQRFECSVDFLVKGSETQGLVPSTLIDATVYPYKVLRQGAFNVDELIKSQVRT